MQPRDDERRTGSCREEVIKLLFSGHFASERHVEMLLDRLEGEAAAKPREGTSK